MGGVQNDMEDLGGGGSIFTLASLGGLGCPLSAQVPICRAPILLTFFLRGLSKGLQQSLAICPSILGLSALPETLPSRSVRISDSGLDRLMMQ